MDQRGAVLVEEHIRHLLGVMGFEGQHIRCNFLEEGTVKIDVELGDEGRLLIGTGGMHLAAFQHVVRSVLRRKLEQDARISVDINGYRARKEHDLLEMAKSVAKEAQRTGQAVVLSPMNAADRRMIHAALAEVDDVKTESLGQEPNRRVVVKPVSL